MRKIKYIILTTLFLLSISSCSNESKTSPTLNIVDPTKVVENITNNITKIDTEVEVSQITSSITDVYNKVYNGCIGVYSKNESTYSTGSGVIFKEDNGTYYAITNEHVISSGLSYKVYFGNGIYVDATLIGSDKTNDIAVLSFSLDLFPSIKENIYIVSLNSNTILSVGETALAIGCPLSLTAHFNNLTSGIVSNYSKLEVSITTPVNSGNSGGGLFNLKGELIGIVYKKDTYSSGTSKVPVDNMGYAIPIDIVNKAVEDILADKTTITRPVIGITVVEVNTLLQGSTYEKYSEYLPTIENKYNYIFITSITDDSAAYKAGLNSNDVLLEFRGYEITELDDISYILHKMKVGNTTTMKIYRSATNETVTISITL